MSKELSIKTIKKELMDALLNDMDILNYVAKRYVDDGLKISQIYNTAIFDYDTFNVGCDYITVEVGERDNFPINNKTYKVAIKMGLSEEEFLTELSSLVTNIVNKLYPNRKRFCNMPFYKEKEAGCATYEGLNRVITFSIESQDE
ncbi:MAG: hypothetical protein SO160_14170 [Lachnospiraceae bacterium]|nr:hypothetical protein [Lachnospiraceae bacterium]